MGVVLLILAVSLAGCVPADPAAAPTPSFSNEAEAFAAAEATYREYVKALNAVDLSDPETFEGVYAWTTGEANSGERKTLSQMYADGWVVDGPTEIALIEGLDRSVSDLSFNSIDIAVCLDVSSVRLMDSEGVSVVSDSRPPVQAMTVTLTAVSTSPTGLLISQIDGREGGPSCES